jgi:lysophospholipase L1-like esterase
MFKALILALTFLGVASAATASSWMTTPTPRPGEWMTRHAGFVREAHAGGFDVLFIGDSITDGWRHMGKDSWRRYFEPLKSANFGISGDGTHNVLWRLQNGELERCKPRVIVLLIGTNNIPWTFDNTTTTAVAAQVVEAIKLLIATIRERQPQAKLLVLGIFPRGEWENPSRACIREVNAELAKLDADPIRYLDLGAIFLEGEHIPPQIMPDFLHPNTRAYGIWAPAMLPAIKKLLAP